MCVARAFSVASPLLSQHVDGLPGGGCGSHRVEGPDGDVSDREAAQTGEAVRLQITTEVRQQHLIEF